MDKITKFLLRLNEKERNFILSIMEKILILDIELLDVKKLKGEDNLFRIRKGKIRIIFKKIEKSGIIVDINYRNKIYKDI